MALAGVKACAGVMARAGVIARVDSSAGGSVFESSVGI